MLFLRCMGAPNIHFRKLGLHLKSQTLATIPSARDMLLLARHGYTGASLFGFDEASVHAFVGHATRYPTAGNMFCRRNVH
jgi:hypothetical protein